MARRATRIAAVAGAGMLIIVAVLVAMWLAQGVSDPPAPITVEKRTQLQALDELAATRGGFMQDANPQVREPGLRDSGRKGVGMFLRNMFFRVAGGIGFDVQRLSALLVPKNPPEPVIMDDPGSFVFRPLQGEVTMPASALSAKFNQYLTAYPGTQMRNLAVTTRPGKLLVDGEVSQVPGVWLPFHMEGEVRLLEGHLFVFDPARVEVAGIGAKGLLNAVSLQLSTLVDIKTAGARMDGNEIVIDLNHSLPPPELDVNVTEMSVDNDGLHLTFNSEFDPPFPGPIVETDSYAMLQGGDVKTMRILMTDVRLQMVARDGGRLNVSFYNYRQQLRDGVLTTTPAGEFVVYLGAHQPADYVPASGSGDNGAGQGGSGDDTGGNTSQPASEDGDE